MRDHHERFTQALSAMPLLASLRGLPLADAVPMAHVLKKAGWGLIDVGLNSPQAMASIEKMATAYPDMVIGAGMVMSMGDVRNVRAAGGALVVSPHVDAGVIRTARDLGLACLPGVATPTEAYTALGAGASVLQLYPAAIITPAAVKAFRALLPVAVPLLVGGGVTLEAMADYVDAGVSGFVVGTALYRPGDSAAAVAAAAGVFVATLEASASSGL
jgi:2-dehydro-3-deoxyphosphogalactonate aldolase